MPLAPLSPVRPVAPVRRPAVAASAPAKPAVAATPKTQPGWSVARVAKTAGLGAGGFVGGGAATFIADLFFHFGNNGGTAWPGGIYLMAAGLAAAGVMALYARAPAK